MLSLAILIHEFQKAQIQRVVFNDGCEQEIQETHKSTNAMNTVTAEQFLKQIDDREGKFWTEDDEQICKALDEYADLKYASSREDKWISVKERLPEPGIKVLVLLKYGAGNTEIQMSYTTKRFPDCFDHLLNERITHWQPLPSPPVTK